MKKQLDWNEIKEQIEEALKISYEQIVEAVYQLHETMSRKPIVCESFKLEETVFKKDNRTIHIKIEITPDRTNIMGLKSATIYLQENKKPACFLLGVSSQAAAEKTADMTNYSPQNALEIIRNTEKIVARLKQEEETIEKKREEKIQKEREALEEIQAIVGLNKLKKLQ